MEGPAKILHAAMELFLQYGFKNVTMDDIARRAGISKKTLYQHFINKHDVVMAGVKWFQTATIDSCNHLKGSASNAVEAVLRVDAELATIYRRLNPATMHELQRYYPEAWEEFRQMLLSSDVEMLREVITRGVEEGFFRAELDPDFTARYRIETALLALQPNLMVSDRYSLLQIGNTITELFLYGIMTPKGQKLYTRYKVANDQKHIAKA